MAGGEKDMTETNCSGWEWNPASGEVKAKKQDTYHSYPVGKQAGVLSEPYAGAYKVREAAQVQTAQVAQGR